VGGDEDSGGGEDRPEELERGLALVVAADGAFGLDDGAPGVGGEADEHAGAEEADEGGDVAGAALGEGPGPEGDEAEGGAEEA